MSLDATVRLMVETFGEELTEAYLSSLPAWAAVMECKLSLCENVPKWLLTEQTYICRDREDAEGKALTRQQRRDRTKEVREDTREQREAYQATAQWEHEQAMREASLCLIERKRAEKRGAS